MYVKDSMHQILLAILVGVTVTPLLVILPLMDHWMMAKAQNTINSENKTLTQNPAKKMIIKDNIVTVVNTTTNETISVRNLAENTGNTTINENLTGTTNENLTGNTTTDVNLTAKFESLQGK